MKKIPLLGDITPAQFLRDYWHKKPLLIRQAIPGFKPVVPFDALAKMATENFIESRLISHFDGEWAMQHGPLTELPDRARKGWTMLVQGANLVDARADALLRQFRFIPDARLDDLMISYASDGGGVGPHFDSYDVFLLQAHGKRRWKIGAQKDLSLVDGMPLKILKNFKPQEEFVLEPGDMLYLPPHYAHDGVAEGECMTYSIGFRAPSYQELGEAFLQFMADSIDLPGRYADPELEVSNKPAEIPRHMLSTIAAEMNKVRFTEEDVTIFLGEHLSEPKHNVFFTGPAKPLTVGRFGQALAKRGVALSLKTQMLYRGKHVFINGESFAVGRADKAILDALANERALSGAALAGASDDVMDALYTWYQDGWVELGSTGAAMDEPLATRFDTRREFGALLRECIARSHRTLQLFDPDFALFALGASDVDAALRAFLAGGGTLQLAMHRSAIIARDCPRFVRLLRDFGHRIECRATPANLRLLTDSFCIGDAVHIVRRFHCDHLRGEAAFDAPAATEISLERFAGIWLESRNCLHATQTGL